MQGWISLHRKFTTWEWYQDSKMVHLFIHLLLQANHDSKKWQGFVIERGQCVVGVKQLNKDLKISIQSIRTCLMKLKSSEILTIKSTNKFSIITVLNYDTYQSEEGRTNKLTNKPLTNNQQTTNYKQECKELKNEKKIKTFKPPTIEEFKEYCKTKGYSGIAEKSFEYYNTANWRDSKGNKIKNWKQKLIGVWFKDDNKDKPKQRSAETWKEREAREERNAK